MTISFENPEAGEPRSSSDGKIHTALVRLKEAVTAQEAITHPVTWYTPKIIATEQTRENTSYGTLSTADEITGVVVPENGLLMIGYTANVKCSVAEAGSAAIFIGSNQLKGHFSSGAPVVQEAEHLQTSYREVSTYFGGLKKQPNESAAYVTTGQILGASGSTEGGGPCWVFAAAGTYAISVKYKATSGSITAKERKLWIAVLGV